LQLGVLLQETGHLPEARDAYEQALTLDPTLQEAKQSLGSLPQDDSKAQKNK